MSAGVGAWDKVMSKVCVCVGGEFRGKDLYDPLEKMAGTEVRLQ